MADIKVAKLKALINDYPDEAIVMAGFEGLTFYKKGEDDRFYFIGRIDFGNYNKMLKSMIKEN